MDRSNDAETIARLKGIATELRKTTLTMIHLAGDGHPGPDTLGLGLLILQVLVAWERFKKELAQKNRPPPKKKPTRGKVRKPG